MHYEIIVSKDGMPYLGTDPWSITTKEKLIAIYETLRNAFPAKKGYHIEARRIETVVESIDLD